MKRLLATAKPSSEHGMTPPPPSRSRPVLPLEATQGPRARILRVTAAGGINGIPETERCLPTQLLREGRSPVRCHACSGTKRPLTHPGTESHLPPAQREPRLTQQETSQETGASSGAVSSSQEIGPVPHPPLPPPSSSSPSLGFAEAAGFLSPPQRPSSWRARVTDPLLANRA